MHSKALFTVDLALYLNIPYMSARATLSLGNALRDNAPPADLRPEQVEHALEDMLEMMGLLETAFDGRLRGASSEVLAEEGELDGADDTGWVDLRDRLRTRARYDHPGFHRLAADASAKVDYGALVSRAKRAKILLVKLFAGEGLAVLRRSYAEQSVSTASILRVIEEDGLDKEIAEVLGDAQVVPVLRDLQERYEEMVAVRSAREDASEDIKALRARLRGAMQLYAVTVLGMINPKQPETVAIVEQSLRPMINFRDRFVRSGSVVASVDPEPEQPAALEGVDSDAEQSDVELGESDA